jgi:hypothetical protein
MRYEYTLTYRDYLDAQKLHRHNRWKAALSYCVWIWVLPILGLLTGLAWAASSFDSAPDWVSNVAAFAGAGLWLAFFIPAMRLYSIRKCWKRLLPESAKKSVRTDISVALEMTSDQIIVVLPGTAEGRYFWSAIVDYAEDERLALVYIKKKNFLFIPRRAMDEAGWAELRFHLAGPR